MESAIVRMRHRAPATVFGAVFLVFAFQVRTGMDAPLLPRLALVLAAVAWFIVGVALRARAWRVADTPLSKVRAATVGKCELAGIAKAPERQPAPGSGIPCAWYHWKLQHLVRSGKSAHWETVEELECRRGFWLTDETGSIWVDPTNADFDGLTTFTMPVPDRGRGWRQVEQRLYDGGPVYLLGPVVPTAGGSGPALMVACAADGDDDYLISDDSQREVAQRLGRWAWLSLMLGAAAAILAPIIVATHSLSTNGDDQAWFALKGSRQIALVVGLCYFGTLSVSWLVRVYNRLVLVRNQAEKAWASIEVQLQRRHDVVANLVSVVKQYAQYEHATLVDVTMARNALPNDEEVHAASAIDSELHGQGAQLVALAEKYPQLHADEQFTKLSDALTDTENRIALAREFYNDAVNLMRDRRGTLPYVLLAPLVPIPSLELFGGSSQPPVTFAFGSGIHTHA